MLSELNQLTLGVSLKDDATFANFFRGPNEQLVVELTQSARGQGERFFYITGLGGEGKTHLLQASCHEANLYQRRSLYLPLSELKHFSTSILEELEILDLVCIDDLHCISGLKDWEEAFFHAYNRIQDAGKTLIVTAQCLPKSLPILPDLVSRFVSGFCFHLKTLSDDEKLAVLIMRADRRGLHLSEEVGRFILNHCPRHMSTLLAALEALDKGSLAAQRKLTIPFVKSILQLVISRHYSQF